MPFCPKCRVEYDYGVEYCTECNAELIPTHPTPIPEEYADADWVELETFPGTLYARMAMELLQREGIPAYTQSDFIGSAYSVDACGIVGCAAVIFVLEPDYERSREVISPMLDEIPNGIDADSFDE